MRRTLTTAVLALLPIFAAAVTGFHW